MRPRALVLIVVFLVVMLIGCSSKNERLIKGKWALSSQMVGGVPSSYWFRGGGDLVAPWEDRNFAIKSKGTYVFLDDKRLKITMESGFYEGSIYFLDIVKITEKELVIRNNYQEIRLKKVE